MELLCLHRVLQQSRVLKSASKAATHWRPCPQCANNIQLKLSLSKTTEASAIFWSSSARWTLPMEYVLPPVYRRTATQVASQSSPLAMRFSAISIHWSSISSISQGVTIVRRALVRLSSQIVWMAHRLIVTASRTTAAAIFNWSCGNRYSIASDLW